MASLKNINNASIANTASRAAQQKIDMRTLLHPKWIPYIILVFTAIIYSRLVFNGFVNIDDDSFILRNPLVRNLSWDGIKDVFTSVQNSKYQPLVNLSFLLEYNLFGFNATAFHITNLLLHLASTYLVYRFIERLSGQWLTAALVSMLFAIHPMHVEEVAWAAERKDVLYAFFYIASMFMYMKYIQRGYKATDFLAVFLLFLASAFSKSTAMTLPLVLIALDLYTHRKMDKRAWIEKIPFLLVGITFAVVGTLSQQSEGPAQHFPESINFVNRIFLFTYVPSFYVVKLFFPFALSVMHYYPDVTDGLLPWQYYASMPFLILLVGSLVFAVRKHPNMKGYVIFGIAFFAITISIMEQIVAVGPSISPERYTYIPYLGFFYVIAQWISGLEAAKQKKAIIITSCFLMLFSIQTWARIGVWKDSDVIFSDAMEKNADVSGSFDYYFMRGNLKAGEGKLQEALEDYTKTISLNPGYAEAYTDRGVILFQTGDLKSALRDYNIAIQLKPKRAKPYMDRAGLEATSGDFEAALKDYNHFLSLDSTDSRGFADRGMVRLNLKDTAGACNDWQKAKQMGSKDVNDFLEHLCH
jgi:hypothetical protein